MRCCPHGAWCRGCSSRVIRPPFAAAPQTPAGPWGSDWSGYAGRGDRPCDQPTSGPNLHLGREPVKSRPCAYGGTAVARCTDAPGRCDGTGASPPPGSAPSATGAAPHGAAPGPGPLPLPGEPASSPASGPGRQPGPRANRRRRGWAARAGWPRGRPGERRTRRARMTSRVLAFMGPMPGSARRRASRSGPSRASRQMRVGSPPYPSLTAAHSAWVRRAMPAGKRCSAGGVRKAASRSAGGIAAIVPASSVPMRSRRSSGPRKAFWTLTC